MDDGTRKRVREICTIIGRTDCTDPSDPCNAGSCYIFELLDMQQPRMIESSCGCVFCDLGLEPDVEVEQVKFHHAPRRGNILCERKNEPTPMAAYRYRADN